MKLTKKYFELIRELKLLDGMEFYAPKVPYLTLKDHKVNFEKKAAVRLICSTKSDLGIISKSIINRIIPCIKINIDLPLWTSTGKVITWFYSLNKEKKTNFIQFDMSNYYPSFKSDLLDKAITFAENFIDIISLENRHCFYH